MATDVEMSGGPVVGSHEPSYYEIALTNRQVVVAFVILLTCLLAAFLSGVWIGRESTVRAQEKLAQAAAAPAAPREGQALEEFQFFKEGDGKKGKKGEAPAAAPAPTVAEEESPAPKGSPLEEPQTAAPAPGRPSLFADREPDVKTPPVVPPVAGPAPLPATRKTPPPPLTPPAAGKAVAERQAEVAKPQDKKGKAAAEAKAAEAVVRKGQGEPAAGKLVIQVFSSPDKDQADKIKDRLVAAGQRAFLSPIRGSGRTMYRVRIGPFDSRDKAEKAAGQVRKAQHLDTWITPQ